MSLSPEQRLTMTAFAAAARVYWLEIFPQTRRERRAWRMRALQIPDPQLRSYALYSVDRKWAHCEGAAAFALLAPRRLRANVVRLAITYQLMIDYLDGASEHPVSDPYANTLRLHRAPQAAVAGQAQRLCDYYMFHPHQRDGGFLARQVDGCRQLFSSLPGFGAVAERAERYATLYAEAQGHCHAAEAKTGPRPVSRRINAEASRHPTCRWPEMLAACDTSLPVLALMALGASPECTEWEVERCCAAYFPWAAALHILLHGMVDQPGDHESASFNQFDHYGSKEEAAEALGSIATRSRDLLCDLPRGESHLLLLAGMVGLYLASPIAWEGGNDLISRAVLDAVGRPARWATLAHRARQGRIRPGPPVQLPSVAARSPYRQRQR
jgi:tetraprenyl-beta-curcumene synthase